jgi:hypothetical protein
MDTLTEERLRMLEFQPSSSSATGLDIHLSSPSASSQSIRSSSGGEQQTKLLRQLWDMTGHWLHQLKREMEQLERDGLLGHAILRACSECADGVAHVAAHLEERPDNSPERLRALQFDSENSLRLRIEDEDAVDPLSDGASSMVLHSERTDDALMRGGMQPAIALCRDIEVALRAVEEEEAMDLADAALTVGHLFLASLQHVHGQWTPPLIEPEKNRGIDDGFFRERVDIYASTSNNRFNKDLAESPYIMEVTDEEEELEFRNSRQDIGSQTPSYHYSPPRVRCLWPPLLPLTEQGLHWTQDLLQAQPWFVNAALALTCWPLVATSAVVGGSVVATDHFVLQRLYRHWEQHPVVIASEVTVASVYQTARLAVKTTRAVARPTLRVAQRQVHRHAPGVRDWLLYRVHHPVATVHETVQGLGWCSGQLLGLVAQQWQEWQMPQHHVANDDASVATDVVLEPSPGIPDISL